MKTTNRSKINLKFHIGNGKSLLPFVVLIFLLLFLLAVSSTYLVVVSERKLKNVSSLCTLDHQNVVLENLVEV